MLSGVASRIQQLRAELRLPRDARIARALDRRGPSMDDPGRQRVIDEGIAWLLRAQDCSMSRDGGVARHYSLLAGWSSSYPETTGYIVPTILDYAAQTHDDAIRERARRMLDWLASIQLAEGGFQGGLIDAELRLPAIFNTGQVLLGLARGVRDFGNHRDAASRAANWMVEVQDDDGAWRRHHSAFAEPGTKVYHTHAAWGLLEAARALGDDRYADRALRNVRWALSHQRPNGWFENCCLTNPALPLTHTIGYTLRGVIEAYRYCEEPIFLSAARRTADGLLNVVGADGRLPGRLSSDWAPAVDWVCLTGSVQIAHCWLLLYEWTRDSSYLDTAFKVNRFVRRTIAVGGRPETRGAVKGSFPVNGEYGTYEYLNWATKFCVDSNALEQCLRGG